jgi:hypothetical protein
VTDNNRDRDLIRLRLIDLAQKRGATWHEIARGMGFPNGKIAKNETKKLARRYERLLRREAETAEGT